MVAPAGGPGTTKSTSAVGDGPGGEVFGWTSILKALGFTSQVSAPGTAAACESSYGCNLEAMPDLHGATPRAVSLDQLGSNISSASEITARGKLLCGARNSVAVITPRTLDRSETTTGNDSSRGKKFGSHFDERAKQKNETASIGAMSTVHVPMTPPDVSQPAPPAADPGNIRSRSSTATPRLAQDTRLDGSAIREGSPSALQSNQALDPPRADADSSVQEQAISPGTTGEPAAAKRMCESAMSAKISPQQDAKQSSDTPSTTDLVSGDNLNAHLPGSLLAADPSIPAVHGDARGNRQISTSIPDRITKSTSKTVSDLVNPEKRSEANQSAPDSMLLREIFAPAREGPINPVHPAGRETVDPFATLDAERAAPLSTWIHAGAHHAEAGYLDPALGWIGVRADATANAVHASLLPSSGEAAQVLGSHLAGLNTYLSEHHGQSATVTMAAPQDGRGGMDDHPGDRQSSRQEQAPGREEPDLSATRVPARGSVGASPPVVPPALAGAARYISVVA